MAAAVREHVLRLVHDERLAEVAPMLEDAELTQGSDDQNWPWAQLILGHILNESLEHARFASKRAPDSTLPELVAARALLRCLWNRDFLHVWRQLDAGSDPAAQSPWSTESAVLVGAIAAKLRARQPALISRSFSKITVANAAALTGLSQDALLAEAARLGWALDSATGMLTVTRPPPKQDDHLQLGALEQLTKQMVALDN